MNKERPSGFGTEPLSSEFIVKWLNLYGITPFDVELKSVRAIDEAFIEVTNDRRSKTSDRS